jgi:hypothetical protein
MNKLEEAKRIAASILEQTREQAAAAARERRQDDNVVVPLRAKASSWRASTILAQDLCDKEFPALRYVVPGLFPEGVSLLVSRPKLGKSWMLQQIGSSVALGNAVLTSTEPPAQGDVLYLNLEDGERRAQRRMTKYFGCRRETWPARMRIATKWRILNQGGIDDLREWCKLVTKPALIMVDTLKRVRPPKARNQSDYDADYEACQGLLDLCREFPGLAVIVAHHDRKMDAEDVFDTVSGTLGLTGGVDTIAILKRSGQSVTLHIQGRDLVDDVEKAVALDRDTCRWMILGEAADVHRSNERTRVLDALRDAPPEGMDAKEIKAEAGLKSEIALRKLLSRMFDDREVEKPARGRYVLPGTPLSQASQSHKGHQGIDKTERNYAATCDTSCDRGFDQSHPLGPPGDSLDDFDGWR